MQSLTNEEKQYIISLCNSIINCFKYTNVDVSIAKAIIIKLNIPE